MAGTFSVLTYNVRGLPPQVIEDRSSQMSKIAPKLEDFHTPGGNYAGISSVVGLQELFYQPYYDTLTDPLVVTYPHKTLKDNGGPTNIGDGLTILSDFDLDDFTRTQWTDCEGTIDHGSDCGTNKGFTFSRVNLEAGVSFDLYTLHADAGQDSGSQAARRKNIDQLVEAINVNSPDNRAVIVMGDTNSLYTHQGTDNIQNLLIGAGLTDAWVQLKRSGIVPGPGDDIDSDCISNPSTENCELVDKILYRDGSTLAFIPQSYAVLKAFFSDNGADLSDHYPVTVTFEYGVLATTTTTTSTSSTSTSTSTSTTMVGTRPCGDPVALKAKIPKRQRLKTGASDGVTAVPRAIGASDALFVLKAAVGLVECELCTCDVNNTGSVSAADALLTLKIAVGQEIPLSCPACP